MCGAHFVGLRSHVFWNARGVGGAVCLASCSGSEAGDVAETTGFHGDFGCKGAEVIAVEPVGHFHRLDPNWEREAGAVSSGDGLLGLIESDPDGTSEGGGVADKPSVLIVVGGASFSSGLMAEAVAISHRGSGASFGDLLEEFGDHPGGAGIGGAVT